MERRVVITGMGCITPLGTRPEQLWERLQNGESGVGYTQAFDASEFPTKFSAEVLDWSIADEGEDSELWNSRGRHSNFAAGAAKQAVSAADIVGKVDPLRFGVYLGSGEGQQNFDAFAKMILAAMDGGEESLDVAAFVKKGIELLNPVDELEQEPNMPAAHLASMFDA